MAQRDMTVGNPAKMIADFTIPVFIGNVFQQLYSMADTIIVGKFVGTKALAAVGSTGTIMFLILGFMMGLTAGFTVVTSQRFGAGDYQAMRKTVGSAAILSGIVIVLMTAGSMLGMKKLLIFMNTPEDIFQDSYSYILVICGGIAATVLYNLLSSVLRALGNSKTPLYFLIFSAFLNVGLDMLLILVFHMGVAGAAWATVISQGVSGLLCLVYIWKKVPILRLTRDDWRFDGHLAKIQISIGVPMALQYSITAVGAMMVQSALNRLGSLSVAAFTAGNKIESVATQAYVALGTAMATYCAQNMGAGKLQRIRQGFKAGNVIGVIYGILTGAILFFWGKYLTYLFISEDVSQVTSQVEIYLRCVGLFFIPLTFVNVLRNGIQGMGYGLLPMMAGVAELVGRGAMALVSSHYGSYVGVCMANPAAWILAASLLIAMYYWVMRQQERIFSGKK